MPNPEFTLGRMGRAVNNTASHFADSNPVKMDSRVYRNELEVISTAVQMAATKTLRASERAVINAEIAFTRIEHVIPTPRLRLIKGNKK